MGCWAQGTEGAVVGGLGDEATGRQRGYRLLPAEDRQGGDRGVAE